MFSSNDDWCDSRYIAARFNTRGSQKSTRPMCVLLPPSIEKSTIQTLQTKISDNSVKKIKAGQGWNVLYECYKITNSSAKYKK